VTFEETMADIAKRFETVAESNALGESGPD